MFNDKKTKEKVSKNKPLVIDVDDVVETTGMTDKELIDFGETIKDVETAPPQPTPQAVVDAFHYLCEALMFLDTDKDAAKFKIKEAKNKLASMLS